MKEPRFVELQGLDEAQVAQLNNALDLLANPHHIKPEPSFRHWAEALVAQGWRKA